MSLQSKSGIKLLYFTPSLEPNVQLPATTASDDRTAMWKKNLAEKLRRGEMTFSDYKAQVAHLNDPSKANVRPKTPPRKETLGGSRLAGMLKQSQGESKQGGPANERLVELLQKGEISFKEYKQLQKMIPDPTHAGKDINVKVRNLIGRQIELQVNTESTIQELKLQVESQFRLDARRQRLILGEQELQPDSITISQARLKEGDVIFVSTVARQT